MPKSGILSIALSAGAASLLQPAPLAAQSQAPLFSADAVKAHLEFLADDLLEGRGSGTRGFDLAALYVATQFEAAGLAPAVNGQWYQPVPMVERTPNSPASGEISIGGETYPFSEHAGAVISGEGKQSWTGGAVFVGYGLNASGAAGVDAFAGLDVRGKALVMVNGTPAGVSPEMKRRLSDRLLEIAWERGAVGFVTLPVGEDSETGWAQTRADFDAPFFNWLDSRGEAYRPVPMRFSGRIRSSSPAVEQLFAGSGHAWSDLKAKAAKGEPLPAFVLAQSIGLRSTNTWRRFTSPNVLGMVRGSDPGAAGECVLVTSHLDHVGIDPTLAGEDKIFNGALDNASGIAALIEVARGIAAAPTRPRRTVVFVATTGEEIGLLGSDYLAAHPLAQCKRTIAVVNLDGGVPIHELPSVQGLGGWHSTIGVAVDKVAKANGIKSVPDEDDPYEYFERTDHYSFAKRGIPAVYLVMGGDDDRSRAIYDPRYHQPGDDLTLPFNWNAGAKFARVAHDLVRKLADAPEPPRWYDDSEFAQRFAKDQPKAARPRTP